MVEIITFANMITVKAFAELTTVEVFEILRARCDVFTVEQKICYPDPDDTDLEAVHVFSMDADGRVHAYLRLYADGAEPGLVHVGRVLTREHGRGLGREIMAAGIWAARERMGAKTLTLHSQQYCIGFYEKSGFSVCSDVFMEADIPHVEMRMTLS